MQTDLEYRKQLARELLSSGQEPADFMANPDPATLMQSAALAAKLHIPFPAGFTPTPQVIQPTPATNAPLPKADVVVVTWTVDEVNALSDVLTPGFTRDHWYRYDRNFAQYLPKIREHAPSRGVNRLGSYFVTKIGTKTVLCFKSELHLNQDGVQTPPQGAPGNASLPIKDLFHQIIDEAKPTHLFTVGTAGGVFSEHDLGDVVVTRAARFRLSSEFKLAPFNHKTFKSDWPVPTQQFNKALELMGGFKDRLTEPDFLPPTINFAPLDHLPKPIRSNDPDIHLDGADLPAFHPILTTDYFEFGTSTNHLDAEGAAVEMGDAVLGVVAEERTAAGRSMPFWLVIRNCSDPQINGALRNKPASQSLQAMWAVYYYKGFGYWTSVMSSLTTWGVVAGLP